MKKIIIDNKTDIYYEENTAGGRTYYTITIGDSLVKALCSIDKIEAIVSFEKEIARSKT